MRFRLVTLLFCQTFRSHILFNSRFVCFTNLDLRKMLFFSYKNLWMRDLLLIKLNDFLNCSIVIAFHPWNVNFGATID